MAIDKKFIDKFVNITMISNSNDKGQKIWAQIFELIFVVCYDHFGRC